MARCLRIRCIVKTERTSAHERINAICGLTPDGSHWTLTHEDAVSQIENGICQFYLERLRDQRYDVIVAMDVRAHRYLKTVEGREQPDQLLYLPACPHVVHTPYSVPGQGVVGAKLSSLETQAAVPHSLFTGFQNGLRMTLAVKALFDFDQGPELWGQLMYSLMREPPAEVARV